MWCGLCNVHTICNIWRLAAARITYRHPFCSPGQRDCEWYGVQLVGEAHKKIGSGDAHSIPLATSVHTWSDMGTGNISAVVWRVFTFLSTRNGDSY